MSHLTGKFVWFEHVSPDLTLARAFYQPLFNWHVESMPMDGGTYPMILNPQNEGIGGLRQAQPGERSRWVSYLSVDDVDTRYRQALAAGAKSLQPPTEFAPVGRGAAFKDPTGAELWIWTSRDGDRPDAADTPVGDWIWNELWTPDVEMALAFYEKVFGYGIDTMDMGPQGTYYQLKAGDKARAGLMQSAEPAAPPMWLPYVRVADCDATAARAAQLGGQTLLDGTDIPGVGRFAILLDPAGAAFAVFVPAPMQA